MNADHKSRAGLAEARRILPSFVGRTSYGTYESNPYSKLFEERIHLHRHAHRRCGGQRYTTPCTTFAHLFSRSAWDRLSPRPRFCWAPVSSSNRPWRRRPVKPTATFDAISSDFRYLIELVPGVRSLLPISGAQMAPRGVVVGADTTTVSAPPKTTEPCDA
ncbi:MAG: hypothetical protein QOI10_4015, partial [Solirubrobacterales bacterium]|nr:hypothetical protein [Solirubrobacterales bacterium]